MSAGPYSERVMRLLVERKGEARAALYLSFKRERSPRLLGPLFRYLRARGARGLSVLEVGCSFGHNTEYLCEQPEVAEIHAFDTDPAFVEIARIKAEELGLKQVADVARFSNAETRRLPYADAAFDLVLVVGVIEHLPARGRREIVDEYYRVLRPGGHIAILDTPNRLFPLETHS
ncbi:MAG TPA: class I SAM-dependent methyltransferase, partial [Thermoanaerobaculia bacterium]|nr:class I SAM-dependent methyltransferase [Thermoanaerobaculia bacterium]